MYTRHAQVDIGRYTKVDGTFGGYGISVMIFDEEGDIIATFDEDGIESVDVGLPDQIIELEKD